MVVPYVACMALVASFYHLPPRVLPAIQGVEGGRPGLVHHNPDQTVDLGVMQINTRWLLPIARFTHERPAVVYQRLRDDACYNIAAGGAILRTYMRETHGNLLAAIGDFHSHTAALNMRYRVQVLNSATSLFVVRKPHLAG